MASEGTKWGKDETCALIDAYSDAKTSAEPMTTNRELYSSIKSLLEKNNGIQRTTKQIETKLKKLKAGYSKLKDRMKTSGAERPYDSKSLSSQEKTAYQHWDKLDRILGTHPVEDPPEEHLLESSAKGDGGDANSNADVNVVESGTEEPTAVTAAEERNAGTSTAEENSQATCPSKTPKRNSGRAGKAKKKTRLCDVVEQSNEQMRQMQDYMERSSVTPEARSKERKEDREFFRQMFGMMSQTMRSTVCYK